MKTWKVGEAKAKFSAVLNACKKEPQVICRRNVPMGVLVNMDEYNRLQAFREKAHTPTVAQLMTELRNIQAEETGEISLPKRRNRRSPSF